MIKVTGVNGTTGEHIEFASMKEAKQWYCKANGDGLFRIFDGEEYWFTGSEWIREDGTTLAEEKAFQKAMDEFIKEEDCK